MTTRNMTKKFESMRSQFKAISLSSSRSDWEISDGKSALLNNANHTDSNAEAHINFSLTLPPKWVDIVEEVNEDFAKFKEGMAALLQAHDARLRVSFGGEESERERQIDEATSRVSRSLKSAENRIKKIAIMGADEGLSVPEKNIRLNVMRHLGSRLTTLSKSYRTAQKDFMAKLKQQQQIGSDMFKTMDKTLDSKHDVGTFEDALDRGLNEEQILALKELEDRSDEREREIIHLAQSINDLASLFQELNVLVIEQGTILDRIDYNVEQTLIKVQEGNVELRAADDYSKKNLALKCILIMILIIIIEVILFIWKKS